MMKILVCIDGSAHTEKTLKEASKIAGGCSVDEVVLLNVYESFHHTLMESSPAEMREQLERFEELKKQQLVERQNLLEESVKAFDQQSVNVTTRAEEGHPAETIINVVNKGNFDMVVLGSRGLGGLKKLFLGSVSNAVLQQVNTNVYIVR
jgi:nucleotide-binding universal stress UspA family protein